MKKSVVIGIGVVVLGVLAFLATNLVRNSGKSDTELLEFSIADTSSIDKVIIHDAYNNTFELKREGGSRTWTDVDGGCIQQAPGNMILETIKNIEFKGYVPENSRKLVTTHMMATSVKVQIFANGKWVKTWYVGGSTPDHYGTYMLLETPSEKSDLPVIMRVKGLNGIIEPRFFADPRRWNCTEVFAIDKQEIASVDVKYNDIKQKSFSVERNGLNYIVKQNGKAIDQVDTAMAVRYLNNFRKIHYEMSNYEFSPAQVDSLKKTTPFAVLTLKKTSGDPVKLKMYRIKGNGEVKGDDYGQEVDYDVNRFWCVLPSGELVKCQYFVFNPIIMGHIYFRFEYTDENSKEINKVLVHKKY